MEANLKQKLETDLKQAMRAKDNVRRSTIRLVMAAIKNAEIAQQTALDDPGILGVIAEVGAQGPHDKGKVMPQLIAKLKGRADGKEINAVVTELLGT